MTRPSLSPLLRDSCGLPLVFACTLLAGSPAHAQTSTLRACLDAIPDSALRQEIVYLVPELRDSSHVVRPLTLSSFDLLAQTVAQAMRLPDDSSTRARGGVPDSVTWRELSGDVLVTVHRNGTFAAHAVKDASDDGFATGNRGLALILRAANEVARTGEIFPWDAEQEGDSLTFALSLTTPTHGRDGTMRTIMSRLAFPVFAVCAPWSDVVTPLPGKGSLRYPDDARHRGYQGEIHVQFIVDTTGRAVESSIRDFIPDGQARPTGEHRRIYDEFVREVHIAIPTMRFRPGSVAGCVLPVKVHQPFTFTLSR